MINFPNTPSVNDTHVVGSTTYTWDGTSWKSSTAAPAASLDGLSDVDLTTTAPVTGDIMEFDGTNWVTKTPVAASTISKATIALDEELLLGHDLYIKFNSTLTAGKTQCFMRQGSGSSTWYANSSDGLWEASTTSDYVLTTSYSATNLVSGSDFDNAALASSRSVDLMRYTDGALIHLTFYELSFAEPTTYLIRWEVLN